MSIFASMKQQVKKSFSRDDTSKEETSSDAPTEETSPVVKPDEPWEEDRAKAAAGERWMLQPSPSDAFEGIFASAPETTVPCHRGTALGKSNNGRLRNRWREVPSADILIRGSNYLTDGVKQPSARAAFRVVGLDVLHTRGPNSKVERVYSVGGRPNGFVDRYRKAAGEATPFLLLFNFLLPWGNLIIYTAPADGSPSPYAGNDAAFNALLREFLEDQTASGAQGEAGQAHTEKDAMRNSRLKLIPRCYDGPRVVRKVVTGKPAITGTKIEHKYFSGEGWFEVALNICSSRATGSIFALCNGLTQSVDIDMGFVLEGRKAEELPERLLAAIRFYRLETVAGIVHMKAWEDRP